MPFIKSERRNVIDVFGLDRVWRDMQMDVDDICYVFYKEMVGEWKANPRWATAHEIYKKLHYIPIGVMTDDEYVARQLAWQVFFIKYVIPYENQKEIENGTI